MPGRRAGAEPAHAASRFVAFETGQTRPLALSADGARLYALNTPDNALEIFRIGLAGIAHEASVPVGMEPVAVATHGPDEVWVVNQLSDSISVVDVASDPPRVARTQIAAGRPSRIGLPVIVISVPAVKSLLRIPERASVLGPSASNPHVVIEPSSFLTSTSSHECGFVY